MDTLTWSEFPQVTPGKPDRNLPERAKKTAIMLPFFSRTQIRLGLVPGIPYISRLHCFRPNI
ncbi:MAG: hypothetical protein OXS28_14325 [Gammaproteobacteria bacterium]|nr:hypothetical protein [Gammaproteobacteria bacterium]MDE0286013.1 hypothetical protein [Gammaproteobacteria bacterium]